MSKGALPRFFWNRIKLIVFSRPVYIKGRQITFIVSEFMNISADYQEISVAFLIFLISWGY